MQKQNQHNVDLILKKLKNVLHAETDQQLATVLGVSPQVLSNWKNRKRIDYSLIIDFSKKHNINLHWLFGNESGENYIVPDSNKQNVNEEVVSYVQIDQCKTCKIYERVLQQFELIIQQQAKTIELLSGEFENLRRLYEDVLKKVEENSR